MSAEIDFTKRTAEPKPEVSVPYPSDIYRNIQVLLASNSPRRRELLSLIMPTFKIAEKRDIKELYPSDLSPEKIPEYLSVLKAEAYSDILTDNELIITADTVVILDGKVLGKPEDASDAKRMLGNLAGKEHRVVTGVTLSSRGGKKQDTFSEATNVHFAALTENEIERYVNIFAPMDKAGSYGIQEWIGAAAIDRIDGCFYNVMGLPLHKLYTRLKTFFD